MTNNLQQKSYKQIICCIIFDIINEFVDISDKNIVKEKLTLHEKQFYNDYILYLFDLIEIEYSYFIFMIIIMEKIVINYKISKKDDSLKYVIFIAFILSHKNLSDEQFNIKDLVKDINLDLNKYLALEKVIFQHLFITNNFNWNNLYNEYNSTFQQHLDIINTKKFIEKHLFIYYKKIKTVKK